MKIALVTDTHYGHSNRTHKVHEKFLKKLAKSCVEEKVDVLIHAGDWISVNQHQLPRTFKMFREAMGDIPILGVLGNHDHWDYDYWGVPAKKRRFAKHPAGMSLPRMMAQHKEWAEEYNIQLLENNPYRHDEQGEDDVVIYGFNGWYNQTPPNTNDPGQMAKMYETCPAHVYLANKASKDLNWVLSEVELVECENEKVKKICVTHFPPYSKQARYLGFCANPKYLNFIADKFDVLLVGHSHQQEDFIEEVEDFNDEGTWINTLRCINAGTEFDPHSGGYDKPNFKIFEV
jgi:predicted phosphodiesterase